MTARLSIIDGPMGPVLAELPLPVGTRIDAVVPVATPGVAVTVDEQWILRAQWGHELQDGQHLEVHHLAAGSDGRKALRLVLQIAAVVALGPQGLGLEGFALAAAQIGANLAINALLPIQQQGFGGGATAGSPTYDVALAGNRAAIDQPLPVLYGRQRHFPPFAAQPYQEIDNDTNDQYYHALLCLGMGYYTLESLQIEGTAIESFEDVQTAVLQPGDAPTLVLANVANSEEVADFPLNPGRSSPAITACREGLTATHLGFDVVFPGGLGDATGSSVTTKTVDLRFEWREVDDYGVPLSPWAALATETISAASTEPVRRSYKYALGGSVRPQGRVVRTTPRDDNPLVRNDGFWVGLRAYLAAAAPLAAGATYLEMRMRATEQLNGLSQRRLAAIQRRLLYTWSTASGWSATRVFTRNPAWAIVDKLRDTSYGNALPDARIDLATFESLAATWEARQDHFDYVFDTAISSDDADQLMARAGRARCFWRNGVRSIMRDEVQTQEVAAFTGRDILPNSTALRYDTNARKIPDAIVLEYFSHLTWAWESVTCKAPGVVTPVRPEYMRLAGVGGAKHAEREGLYEAAARALRRKFTNFTTELQGLLPAYGSLVRLSTPLRNNGQHGDVVDYDSGAMSLEVTEPLTFTVSVDHFITLVRPDGSVHDPILVTPGADAYTVTLDELPDFEPVTDAARQERTRFIFGNVSEHQRQALVLAIRPRETTDDGGMLVELSCVNDAAAIHTADNALLPVGSEVQDPIDSPNDPAGGGGGGGAIVPYLVSRTLANSLPAGAGLGMSLAVRFNDDGTLETDSTEGASTTTTARVGEWVLGGAIDPLDAALYELRASVTFDTGGATWTGDSFATWLPLGVLREFTFTIASGDGQNEQATVRFEVREISTAILQASANVRFSLQTADFGD